ncbi:branched-chain amino acid ABC transporter permease [Candidatus Poriferisocius sp.]|uniref:branched-chain amino acid ABC transporter permease n=1 Tax=Candidatus Poriferisocius sp. TaxID=3101276 RepID=UPI003B58BEE9
MKPKVITRGSAIHRYLIAAMGVALTALVIWIPNALPSFRLFQMTLAIGAAVAVIGLALVTSLGGQISLAQNAFFAIGAYTTAILVSDHGWNHLLTLPVGAGISFVIGLALGLPALRLKGLYLALVTMAFAIIIVPLIKRYDGLTGGNQGKLASQPDAPSWSGMSDDTWIFSITVAVAVVMFVLAHNIIKSSVGRSLNALRHSELVAETMGVNVARLKSLAFATSAGFAGVAGGLFTIAVGFVAADSFGLLISIELLAALVVGGSVAIPGAILGASFIEFLPVWASDVNDAFAGVLFGVVLIVVMIFFPAGATGFVKRQVSRVVVVRHPVAVGPAGADRAETTEVPTDEPAKEGTP